ncbi:asparaginase [Deinococcus frigens]|uniref:asparaginase n=1 Tax=Deinococcus frigens TaxID=249403 RepID=UPI00049543F6|nr:asparaginase [Deinococcus frigens]
MQRSIKRLAVIHTGGTIASRPSPDGRGLTPQQAPSVPGLTDVQVHDFQPLNLPSPHITPAHMLELAGLIARLAPEHDGTSFDGMVVTHGTDTLEETAFALHLLLSTPTPVVLTGSMRHAGEVSWDGPANLLDAAGVALHPQSAGRGPLVIFGGDIFDARTVTKVHTTAVDAFGGYPGPIGRIDRTEDAAHVRFFATPEQRRTYAPHSLNARVDILYAYAGWRGEGYAGAQAGADGIVIAALGTGNLPAELLPLIAATEQPVVIATRTHAGPVLPVYGYAGGGATLVEAGAIPASFLNAHKARILLLTLLGSGLRKAEIRRVFGEAGF